MTQKIISTRFDEKKAHTLEGYLALGGYGTSRSAWASSPPASATS